MSAAESTEVVTTGHRFELMDRVNTINIMFDQLIVDHPATDKIQALVAETNEKINELYQAAATAHYEAAEAADKQES